MTNYLQRLETELKPLVLAIVPSKSILVMFASISIGLLDSKIS